jgi:hypothetical protein
VALTGEAGRSRTPWVLALIVSIAFWAAVIERTRVTEVTHPVSLPRGLLVPSKPLGPEDLRRPETCRECHAVEWASWSRSRHAQAARGELFRIGFRLEPRRWCLSCHAPEDPDPRHLDAHPGVTCASCHLREGGIATARPIAGIDAPHALVHDPGLARGDSCRRCHQSDFPLNPQLANQDTMEEWRRAGGEVFGRCVDCHMSPATPEGRAHDFPGTRDATFLARSLPVKARLRRRGMDDVVEITVGPARAGHRVPTGDPFRAVALAWEVTSGTAIRGRGEIILGRRFERRDPAGPPRLVEREDTRLHAGEIRVIERVLPPAPPSALTLRVRASLRFLPRWMITGADWPVESVETPFADIRTDSTP